MSRREVKNMMNNWLDFGLAAMLVVAALLLAAWFLKYKASRSERRMQRMLKKAGVHPGILDEADTESVMAAVRQRCEKCQAEDVCERWLDGTVQGENDFCPNAEVFRTLKKRGQVELA